MYVCVGLGVGRGRGVSARPPHTLEVPCRAMPATVVGWGALQRGPRHAWGLGHQPPSLPPVLPHSCVPPPPPSPHHVATRQGGASTPTTSPPCGPCGCCASRSRCSSRPSTSRQCERPTCSVPQAIALGPARRACLSTYSFEGQVATICRTRRPPIARALTPRSGSPTLPLPVTATPATLARATLSSIPPFQLHRSIFLVSCNCHFLASSSSPYQKGYLQNYPEYCGCTQQGGGLVGPGRAPGQSWEGAGSRSQGGFIAGDGPHALGT